MLTPKVNRIYRGLRSDKRGDTIVEALIATGIITLVLISAYAITNRNSLAAQDTQEHMRAARLVESQIEALRSKTSDDLAAHPDFCIDVASAALDIKDVADHTEPCTIGKGSSGAEYKLSITRAGGTYKVKATWTSLTAQSEDDAQVTMYYRTAQ